MFRFSPARSVRLAACTAFFAAFAVLPVFAEEEDPNVVKIRKMFENTLTQIDSVTSLYGQTMIKDGDVSIEKSGDYYAVTLPHLSFNAPNGMKTEIGIIAANMKPEGRPDLWKMALALPSPMTFFNYDGTPLTTVKVGKQHLKGLWHEKLSGFVKMDMAYEDFTFDIADSDVKVSLPAVTAQTDMEEDANGKWSGPTVISVKGLTTESASEGAKFSLEEASVTASTTGLSPDAMQNYNQKSEEFLAQMIGNPEPSPEMVVSLLELYNGMMDSATADLKLKNLSFTAPDVSFSLGSVVYGFDLKDLMADKASLAYRIGYGDLDIPTLPEDMKQFVPAEMSLDFRVAELPIAEIFEVLKGIGEAAKTSPQAGEEAKLQAMAVIPQILAKAGTKFVVQENFIGNDLFRLELNGEALANSAAIYGATAKFQAVIKGLDTLSSKLQELSASNPMVASVATSALPALAMAQMLGQQATDASGAATRSYVFELDKNGKTLMNGTDLNDLLGGAMGGAPVGHDDKPPMEQ